MTIERFDGLPVPGAFSRGSRVFAAFDWRIMALEPHGPPILAKAQEGNVTMLRYFPPQHHAPLTSTSGHYSNAQSINSEDTVTWSVFGAANPAPWLPDLLALAFGSSARPSAWTTKLWERTPHPDTGNPAHGPEADGQLDAPGWRYVIEAKWLSDLDGNQGAGKDSTQLDMRAHAARAGGLPPDRCGVLVIAPSPARYEFGRQKAKSVFREYFEPVGDSHRSLPKATALGAVAVTWEGIAALLEKHPSFARVRQYLDWRLSHT